MNIVMITTNDPAGSAANFRHAIRTCTPHRCRLITTEVRYNFMFEKDLHVPDLQEVGELEHVLGTADVFHFHMGADENLALGPLTAKPFIQGKVVVHHHHGEPAFRSNPERYIDRETSLGRRAIVGTPDLLRLYPDAEWIPNPVPLDDPEYLPCPKGVDGEVVVTHSPTRKELKNTDEFIRVMGRLNQKNSKLTMRIIEMTPHRECLRIKRQSDLFFDHMQGYFGLSSLEALAQGVPTLAGLDDWNRDRILEFTGAGGVPWIRARNERELENRIEPLAQDAAMRRTLGMASRRWMETYWNERRIAEALLEFYRRAEVVSEQAA